ncbi:unnamed protein product [Urochloa humidicola]
MASIGDTCTSPGAFPSFIVQSGGLPPRDEKHSWPCPFPEDRGYWRHGRAPNSHHNGQPDLNTGWTEVWLQLVWQC